MRGIYPSIRVAGITSRLLVDSKLYFLGALTIFMQSRLPVSKPLALVVIGLIIGVSLGLGSGYAVFYPDMVTQRNKTIEERVVEIEDDLVALDQRLMSVNESISSIDESLEGILALTGIVDGLSSRLSALEGGQVTLNTELNNLEDEMDQLESDFATIGDSWDMVQQSFSDLEAAYSAVNSELEDIQVLVRENDGTRILTAYMANPSVNFEQNLAMEIFDLLEEEEQDFEDWILLYGENTAKILLQQEVDTMAGGLVWNPTQNTAIGGNNYQVKLETYCTLEFSPAKVTVNNLHLEIRATVNIESGAITSLQVALLEIV